MNTRFLYGFTCERTQKKCTETSTPLPMNDNNKQASSWGSAEEFRWSILHQRTNHTTTEPCCSRCSLDGAAHCVLANNLYVYILRSRAFAVGALTHVVDNRTLTLAEPSLFTLLVYLLQKMVVEEW